MFVPGFLWLSQHVGLTPLVLQHFLAVTGPSPPSASLNRDGTCGRFNDARFATLRLMPPHDSYIWVGTNNGTIYEVDTKDLAIVGARKDAHHRGVTHIFRW